MSGVACARMFVEKPAAPKMQRRVRPVRKAPVSSYYGRNISGRKFVGHGMVIGTTSGVRRLNMKNLDMREVTAHGAVFSYVNLDGVNALGGDFRGSWFLNSTMTGIILGDAKLIGVRFENVNLTDAHFEGAKVNSSIKFSQPALLNRANCTGASFQNAQLRGAELRYVNLTGANLNGADFTGAKFVYTDVLAAKNVEGAIFVDSTGISDRATAELRKRGALMTTKDVAKYRNKKKVR